MAIIEITSFGYGHPAGRPRADIEVDLRPYRDPHVRPEFRTLTARDQIVRDTVRSTPGIPDLLGETVIKVERCAAAGGRVTVSSGCVGGRHRGPGFAMDLASALQARGHKVWLTHRDIDLPVIQR